MEFDQSDALSEKRKDDDFGRAVNMLKKISDTNDKKIIAWAVSTIAVAHKFAESKERIKTLEDCLNDVKKTFPPPDMKERRFLWKKLKIAGLI